MVKLLRVTIAFNTDLSYSLKSRVSIRVAASAEYCLESDYTVLTELKSEKSTMISLFLW